MTRLWLIRHGASSAAPGLAVGASDPPLGREGRAQAKALASLFAGRPLARIVSSDLRRASETAAAIAAPHRLEVELDPALREIDFGAWEGRALGELWKEDPAAGEAWAADVRATPAGFGEGLGDLERRVGEFWAALLPLLPAGEVAIVGHRGSLAVLRALITGEPVAETLAAPLAPGSAVAVQAALSRD